MSKKKKTQKQQQEPLVVTINDTVLEIIEGQEDEVKEQEEQKVEEQKVEEQKVEEKEEVFNTVDVWFQKENLQDTIDLIKTYRNQSIENVISNVDLPSEEKVRITSFFNVMGWIEELQQVILLAALNNEWEICNTLLVNLPSKWKLLRKLFGNWEQIRDKRQLKEMCLKIFKDEPKAVVTLNKWAIEYAKGFNLLVKGYCDLCCQDAKIFILQNSEV